MIEARSRIVVGLEASALPTMSRPNRSTGTFGKGIVGE